MMIKKIIFLTSTLFLSCADNSLPQFNLQQAFPNLSFSNPVDLQNAGDGTDKLFVVEQAGKIYVFENNAYVTVKKLFLNIVDSVSSGGEMGLLGLAFHPNYENNRYFYVNYTKTSPVRRTLIVRFEASSTNPDSADRASSKILMEIVQPFSNHNGGQLAFGPDGYLYIALGDGGSGGDPQNYAQNKSTLLGKLLRIDVDKTQGSLNYAIPADNPFKNNTQGFKEEIYAYGLRNPWRFSFDFLTGKLWCADVGQNAWEEIDIVINGGNYGWRCYEGNHSYDMSKCSDTNYIPPIWEYSHSEGISITGGYVYRGPNLPQLYGKYIYADFGTKKIWALTYDGINPATNQLLLTASRSITSFGVDINNELYVVAYDGIIYRFTPTASIVAPTNLRFTVNSPNSATLNWNDNSNNETGFKIERKVGSEDFVFLESVDENFTTYTDNTINDTQVYSYRAYAYNATDSSGYSNTTSVVTDIPVELNAIPEKFRLMQNYPNPFNPTTKISYAIPTLPSSSLLARGSNEVGFVSLKVYDVLGNEVATLVNEEKPAGFFEVTWDSANSPSGVYFYEMQVNLATNGTENPSLSSAMIYAETKKMVLLR
jgi:glucose/arabinose dehydrogenase